RDAFGDADHQVEVGFDGFPDGSSSASGRYVNNRHGGASGVLGIADATVDGYAFEIFASALGVDASHESFAAVSVFTAHAGMELAGFTGDTLRDDLGVFVDQNRHVGRSSGVGYLAASTTRVAASA